MLIRFLVMTTPLSEGLHLNIHFNMQNRIDPGSFMNSTLLYILLALAAGICIPTQAGINAQLSQWTRSPALAAGISFAVGTVALVIYVLVSRIPLPPAAALGGAPWWIWGGGALGAFFVAVTIFLVPKLGATTMLALVLAGQMVTSLLLDHFGAFAFPVHPISLPRVLGVLMVAAGVVLIQKY
jgi:transporter family-2 protein